MSNQKLKNENYSQLGGINSKVSQYQNSPFEFLDIKNFDFQTPGALTSRWGSTQYVSQGFSSPITSIYEFIQLNGSSYVVVGASGAQWYGATTGLSQGMSFNASQGVTIGSTIGLFIQVYSFASNLGGGVKIVSPGVYYQGITSMQFKADPLGGQGGKAPTFILSPGTFSNNQMSFVTFQNYLFGADGNRFFKFDGTTTYFVGLPFPTMNGFGFGASTGYQSLTIPNQSYGYGATHGSYIFYISYVNNRGFESQIWPIGGTDITQYTSGATVGTESAFNAIINTPLGYGISSINLYYYFSPTTLYWSGTTTQTGAYQNNSQGFLPVWNYNYTLLSNQPVSGSTISEIYFGISLPGDAVLQSGATVSQTIFNLINNAGSLPDPVVNTYYPLGATVQTSGRFITEIDVNTKFYPRYLEIYKDRLFCCGFSAALSTVYFSDITEPEGFAPDANFEVRTNDGDYLTAMKSYSTRLCFFKKSSFHVLNGDGPENFFLQEISLQYGALNNNCVSVYDDILLFLDRKGLMEFNGANVTCISSKVQPYFDRMNYNVALNTACMEHDKLRNQIIIAIPIDSATNNNIMIVYDYMVNAWTTYSGVIPTYLKRIQGRNNLKNVFYGTSSGLVNWFGSSFLSDNGVGFTTYFKSRFLHDMGDSIEKQWRRLYLNADQTSATLMMPVNFYQDYGSSIVYSTTFLLGQFQNRIDFGIPAKSISFELYNLSTSSPLRIYGFTVESRLQRMV